MGRIIEFTNAGSTVKVDKYALAVDSIKAIAKPSNGDGCIVYLVGDKFLVKESYDEVKKMMDVPFLDGMVVGPGLVMDDNDIRHPIVYGEEECEVDEKQDESCY